MRYSWFFSSSADKLILIRTDCVLRNYGVLVMYFAPPGLLQSILYKVLLLFLACKLRPTMQQVFLRLLHRLWFKLLIEIWRRLSILLNTRTKVISVQNRWRKHYRCGTAFLRLWPRMWLLFLFASWYTYIKRQCSSASLLK